MRDRPHGGDARIRGKDLFTAKALIARSIKQRPFSAVWLFDSWQPCQAIQPNPWRKVLLDSMVSMRVSPQRSSAVPSALLRLEVLSHANSSREEKHIT